MVENTGCEPPKIFKQCSVEGLYRLLRFLDEYGGNVSALHREVFKSHVQAEKYLRLAKGLQLVKAACAPRTPEGGGPHHLVYGVTGDGRDWLDRLKGYDETRIVGGRLILRSQPEPKVRAYKDTGLRRSKIP